MINTKVRIGITGGERGIRSFVSLCKLAHVVRRLLPLPLQSVFSNPVKYAPMAYFTKFTHIKDYRIQYLYGGEGGIRTLEAGLHPPNRLAGGPFRPLKHLSCNIVQSKQYNNNIFLKNHYIIVI